MHKERSNYQAHTPEPPEGSLAQRILAIKQAFSSYTNQPLLDILNHELIQQLEQLAASNEYAAEVIKEIQQSFPAGPEDIAKLRVVYNKFAEARMFLELSRRKLPLERVCPPRDPATGKLGSSPDFRALLGENEARFEFKAFSMEGGDEKYLQTVHDGLEAKIELESQHRAGQKIAFAEHVISPLGKHNAPADSASSNAVAALYISKIEQNLKKKQFKEMLTIMVIDCSQIGLNCGPREAILPIYFVDRGGNATCGSGPLWYAAFGKQGERIFRPAEWAGASNLDGFFGSEGVLSTRKEIGGLIFRIGWDQPKYVGLLRDLLDQEISQFIVPFCDNVNDEKNTCAWSLLGK